MQRKTQLEYNDEKFTVIIKFSKKNIDKVSYNLDTNDRQIPLVATFPVGHSRHSVDSWLQSHTQNLYHFMKDTLYRIGLSKYTYEQGELHPYLGKEYPLNLIISESGPYKVELNLKEKRFDVFLSHNFNSVEVIIKLLKNWYFKEAYIYFKNLSDHYREQMDFIPKGDLLVEIVEPTTFFGRCFSGKNIVQYAYNVIKFPPPHIEYLVVHELCHFKEPNHEPAFWRLVNKYFPEWRRYDKTLDKEAIINKKGV